jgi:beta-phosphoglucomutase
MKLILTDFDGTLVDTFKANYFAYKEVLLIYEIDLKEELYKACFGLNLNDFLNKISDRELPINDIKKIKNEVYKKYFDKIILNKGLVNILQQYEFNNIPIGIVSTASQNNILNVLEHFKINNIFDFIISGEDVSSGKPSPEGYEKAIRKFEILPSDVLVFEDTEIGVESARAANLNVIHINKFYNEV